MTLKSLADTLAISPARSAEDRRSIDASWDTLAAALEEGRCSEAQFALVMDQEPPDDADALVHNLWARTLRRAAADPKGIGTDIEWGKTYKCRCWHGSGWTYETKASPISGIEVVYAKPCPDCNYRQRELWLDCWTEGGDHRCTKCWRAGGKTPTPLAGDRGKGQDVRDAEAEEASLREAAMVQDTLR